MGTDIDVSRVTLYDGAITIHGWKTFAKILETDRLKVPGRHNVINAMVAAACAYEMEIESSAIAEGLASFRGLPHRLEPLGEYKGVSFYNDSKATTPEAAAAGVKAFGNKNVIPILGGYDKKVSFDRMAEQIAGNVRWAALIGETAPFLAEALERADVAYSIYGSLAEAFGGCVSQTHSGDIVILTPGCASYDMFNNFVERGEVFRGLVKEYTD